MSTKTIVELQLRETGMTQPVEDVDGKILGWTQRKAGQRYFNLEMTVEQFNQIASKLYTARFNPGFEPIPQILVTEGETKPDERDEKIRVLQAEVERLTAELDEATKPPPVVLTVEMIKEKMAEQKWQTINLCKVLGVTKEALEEFINAHQYDFHLSEKGGWINAGPRPKDPLS